MAWREQLTLDELDKDDFDLLLAGWTATDRAAHMFWRYRDPKHPLYTAEGNARYGRALEDVYTRMDEIVGKVMGKVKENDLLMVLSDHGFHSYRTGFAVNTWLVRNGYMTLKGQSDAGTASSDAPYLRDVDWSGTQAYGLGLSSVYLNLVGREGQGIVSAAEASKVRTELKEKLMAVTDPATGDKVFRSVQTCDEAYKGASMEDAPDLILGYNEGYQVAKPSASGAAPEQLFAPNDDKWSGEHAGSDPAITPGILFANQPLKDGATLVDLGVTTLEYLGCAAVPDDYEGRSLLVSEAG